MVAAFYRRVAVDELLRPMYPEEDLAAAESRLCRFLIYRLGGPADYLEQRGHPRLRLRHAPFVVTPVARDRWVELMEAAMDECEIPADVAAVLKPFFGQTATFLVNAPA